MGRGTGTASLESNLPQQLMAMREEVIYDIFLDLHKDYYILDRCHCLEIFAAFGVVPQVIRLLRRYWDWLTMVERASSYSGTPFKGHHGMTQGEPLPPKIFNVLTDAVLWHWVTIVAVTEKTENPRTEGFGWGIQQLAAYFYANNAPPHSQRGNTGYSRCFKSWQIYLTKLCCTPMWARR